MSNLKGKYVVVTGASSGIGEALALDAAKAGARLILCARRLDALQQVKEACLKFTDWCEFVQLDLANEASIEQASAHIIGLAPQLDVLVNNAGISQRARATEASFESEKHIMQVNFFGPVLFTKLLFPHMAPKAGIIITSSVVGLFGFPTRSTYSASKHALHGYFNTMAIEERGRLQITIACPGRINTPISFSAVKGDGSVHGQMDEGQAKGIRADVCAKKIWKAYARGKSLVLVARGEKLLYWFSKYIPPLYRYISSKVSPL
ncbi:MAG: SDR family NAD(P)-dependent oxidoreductase [Bacteroidia bacterium]